MQYFFVKDVSILYARKIHVTRLYTTSYTYMYVVVKQIEFRKLADLHPDLNQDLTN
jgi:hypothetical protein